MMISQKEGSDARHGTHVSNPVVTRHIPSPGQCYTIAFPLSLWIAKFVQPPGTSILHFELHFILGTERCPVDRTVWNLDPYLALGDFGQSFASSGKHKIFSSGQLCTVH
ncbi:hypothetical protein N7540_011185 [Penicillium herquei]|nr:hypothetical protein N7540_011185 [Penicillium herquei]